MKKFTSLFTLLFCLFWYSSCFGVMSQTNVIVSDSAIKDVVLGAKATTAVPTYTNTATVPLSVDTNGYLRVTGSISGRTLTSSSVLANPSTITTTQLVASAAGQIKVYNIAVSVSTAGIQVFKFVYGTGVNCATGTTDISPTFTASNSSGGVSVAPFIFSSPNFPIFTVPANNALCINTSSALNTGVLVSYIQE